MKVPLDTTPKMQAIQDELLRRKTPEERFRMAQEFNLGLQRLAFASLRQEHPEWSDDEIWLELAKRRLGEDVVRKVRERARG